MRHGSPAPFASALLVVALVGVTLPTRTARADATRPSVDVRSWQPSSDAHAGLALEPATTPGALAWNLGAWLQYAQDPVTLHRQGTDDVLYRPVQHLLAADVTAAIGIGARASLGVDVPLILFQDGSSGMPATITSSSSAPTSAIGDVRVDGKATIVDDTQGGLGLAALGNVWLPTGDRGSFAGDRAVRVGARLLAEWSLVVARAQASVGYVVRTVDTTWPAPEVSGTTFGGSIPWTLGIALRPGLFRLDPGDRQSWEVALHGALPGGPVGPFGTGDPGSARQSAVMLAADDRVALGHYKDSFVLAGVDVGLDRAIGVPSIRGVLAVGWAPREHDQDHDGVPDDRDQCPEIAEDKDGFEDADGCPEIDDDDDGIVDAEDACPRQAGVPSSDPRVSGCPAKDVDGDGVPDTADACPTVRGPKSVDAKSNGCPPPPVTNGNGAAPLPEVTPKATP